MAEETRTIATVGAFRRGYSYQPDDQLASLTYPDDEQIVYAYNERGLLRQVGSFVAQLTYTALDQPDLLQYGNGTQVDYQYWDKTRDFRLAGIRSGAAGAPTSLLNLGYDYDAAGNVTLGTDSGAPVNFTYDALDRLKTARGAYQHDYAYDEIGNLTTRAGVSLSYNPSGVNRPRPTPSLPKRSFLPMALLGVADAYPAYTDSQPHAVVSGGDGFRAEYDANGNMSLRVEAGLRYEQAWDAENCLQTVTNTTTGEVTLFTYDGDGGLVRKDVRQNDVTRSVVYIGRDYEKDLSTGAVTKHYYAGQQRIAVRSGGSLHYLYTDHLGSSRASATGTTKQSSSQYYPYGAVRATTGQLHPQGAGTTQALGLSEYTCQSSCDEFEV